MFPVATHSLQEEVETRLRQHSRLRDYPIKVIDQNGTVILRGEVPSRSLSCLAEDYVWQLQGVFKVSNELQIRRI